MAANIRIGYLLFALSSGLQVIPTPEQVSAAREWLKHRYAEGMSARMQHADLAALLAAREAAAYKRGWEACREKAVTAADAWGGPPALPNSARIAHALATLIRALEPPSGEGE